MDVNFKSLNYWKMKAPRYRLLALIAPNVFVMPISTIALESAFSIGFVS